MSNRVALGLVAGWIVALLLYRMVYVEPREWGAICAAVVPPLACAPRAGLLWLQHFYVWGAAALVLGGWAFIGAPLGVTAAAVGVGVAAVINYNATWGMLGAVLGGWAWVTEKDS